MNKLKTKQVLKVISCIIISLIIYSYFCMIFAPKNIKNVGYTTYYKGEEFMSEPEKDSIDVMIFGNSNVAAGIKPLDIYQKYGYTSFVSGAPWQTMEMINILLFKSIKNQSPKIVILETDCLYETLGHKQFKDKFLMSSAFTYHSRWKEIKFSDFYNYPSNKKIYNYDKGYRYAGCVKKVKLNKNQTSKSFLSQLKSTPCKKFNFLLLNNFLDLCEKNNIIVIFSYLPCPACWNSERHDDITKVAKSHNIQFIDFNTDVVGYKVNYETDFRDNGVHLNCYGAERVTNYLGQYLQDNYSDVLKDRRQEKRLYYWNNSKYNPN